MPRIIVCPLCGEDKAHYAKSLCKICYLYIRHGKHKEKRIRDAVEWGRRNPDKRKIICKRWRKNHREQSNEMTRIWRFKNKDKVKGYRIKYKLKQNATTK